MEAPGRAGPPLPTGLAPHDSRTKRLERQQARFRDRGGIFVPSNRNTLLEVLLSRNVNGESPRTAAAAARQSPRRSTSMSPIRRKSVPRESHTPQSSPRKSLSHVKANAVAGPSNRQEPMEKPKPKRRKAEDSTAAEKPRPKTQKADSTATRVKPEPKAHKRSTKRDVESADDPKPPTKRTRKKLDEDPSEQPKKRPKVSKVTTLADIPEEEVEPPDLPAPRSAPSSVLSSKRKGKTKASLSVSTEVPKLESVVQIAPPKPKRGKGKAKAVGSPLDEGSQPADTAPSTFKKGTVPKSVANEGSNPNQADQIAPSTSRKGKAKAVNKPVVDSLGNDAHKAAGTKPKASTKKREPKQEASHFSDVETLRSDGLTKDATRIVGSPPPRGKPRSEKRKQDSILEEPIVPRKRLKKQAATVDECDSSEEKPTRKKPSSQRLKENSATKPPRITSKFKAPPKQKVSRRPPKSVLERIQRSLNESLHFDDEPDPIDFLR